MLVFPPTHIHNHSDTNTTIRILKGLAGTLAIAIQSVKLGYLVGCQDPGFALL